MVAFVQRLEAASEANRSLLCVGLDPDPKRMPVSDVFEFNRGIIDATLDLVCTYKPNMAFYEALGIPGLEALQRTVQYIRSAAPNIPVIADAKRGDLGPSAESYAKALFEVWDFDAVTANAWGGRDSIQPFFEHQDKGVFIWCRSSNATAADIQDLVVGPPGQEHFVFEALAEKVSEWNIHGNMGLVVGATYPQELELVRGRCPDMPILIPGIGAQGGDLEESVRLGSNSKGRMAVISSSRGVLYASSGADFPQAARAAAMDLRDKMNLVLDQGGRGWS